MPKDTVRFMYIRDANYEPEGCLAIVVNRRENYAAYGLSVRHPKDAMDSQGRRLKFDRTIARREALHRLNAQDKRTYIFKEDSQHQISLAVLQDVIASGTAPARAVRFAKRWIAVSDSLYNS